MDFGLLLILVGLPLVWHLALVAYAYVDAGRVGMNRKKWAAIAFCVPLFGFFAYMFEREEHLRDPEAEDDLFVDGPFRIHKSRADDAAWNDTRDDERNE